MNRIFLSGIISASLALPIPLGKFYFEITYTTPNAETSLYGISEYPMRQENAKAFKDAINAD